MSHKVVVYGTLRQGGALHGHLEQYKQVDKGVAVLPMKMVDCGWYPALVPSEELNEIYLEMYEVDDTGLDLLDAVEGCPTLYTREQTKVFGEQCYVYQYANLELAETYPEIKSGNFLEYRELLAKTAV